MQILKEENLAKKAKYSGSMLAFFIPPHIGKYLQNQFKEIPGDMVEPNDMHVTLALIQNHATNKKKIYMLLKKFAASVKPFSINIDGFDIFPPNEGNEYKYVLYAKPKSDMFEEIHSLIVPEMNKNGIEANNGPHEFNPHITLKYCDQEPIIDKKISLSIPMKDIYFAVGDKRWRCKLG